MRGIDGKAHGRKLIIEVSPESALWVNSSVDTGGIRGFDPVAMENIAFGITAA